MITYFLGLVMKFFYNMFHNYGVAIILFTIFSKIIILPISILVQKNSIKLISLKPSINKIKIDYYGDNDKIAELENNLYKKEKYHPFLSIIPLVIQLIILVCLIKIINNPDIYIGKDNINLSFIGYDLSSVSIKIYNYLFPFLAALSAFIYCVISMKHNVLQKEESFIYNISITVISVLLSLYLGLYVPIGVVLYWILSNVLSIVILLVLNIVINPKKYIDYELLNKTNKELLELSSDDRHKDMIKKEKNDYKRFFKIDNKHLVIYGENGSNYKYFKGIIDYLIKNSNLIIHYITSDYNDEILNMNITNLKTYYIGEKRLISLMMKIDSDIVLMTTPDLGKYHIKKSYVRKDIEYIFIPHGIGNHNLFGRKGSLDNFDTLFALDKYQKEEYLQGNKVYHLNRKLVDIGYPLLDEMKKEYKNKNNKTIVIAPSWQKDNIIDLCINDIVDSLSKNYKVIVRPHPHYLKHNKNKMHELKEHYKNNKNVIIQDNLTTIKDVLESEILITDWSAIAYEYAYTTLKPVLFINTPMKTINKDYKELGIRIFDFDIRKTIGKSIELNELKNIEKEVKEMIKSKGKYSKKIDEFYKDSVYNINSSSEVAAKYIVNSIKEKIEER